MTPALETIQPARTDPDQTSVSEIGNPILHLIMCSMRPLAPLQAHRKNPSELGRISTRLSEMAKNRELGRSIHLSPAQRKAGASLLIIDVVDDAHRRRVHLGRSWWMVREIDKYAGTRQKKVQPAYRPPRPMNPDHAQ